MLKIVVERWFWESKILIGSLVELHAWLHSYLFFFLLEKLFLSNLNSSSIPSLSVELLSCFLLQSRHLSIAEFVEDFLLDTLLYTCLDTSRHLYLLRFTDLLHNGSARFVSHVSWSLFLDRLDFSPPKPLSLTPNFFLKVSSRFFQVFLHLVSF